MRGRTLAFLTMWGALNAQAPEGQLRFETQGKVVAWRVLGAGHRALVTLEAAQPGHAAARAFVMAHTGPERMVIPEAGVLKELAPAAWKVSHRGDRRLMRQAGATYWCYTPGLVLPVRFRVDGVEWKLVSAELEPKMFVAPPR